VKIPAVANRLVGDEPDVQPQRRKWIGHCLWSYSQK